MYRVNFVFYKFSEELTIRLLLIRSNTSDWTKKKPANYTAFFKEDVRSDTTTDMSTFVTFEIDQRMFTDQISLLAFRRCFPNSLSILTILREKVWSYDSSD